jgi:hypothetical protein
MQVMRRILQHLPYGRRQQFSEFRLADGMVIEEATVGQPGRGLLRPGINSADAEVRNQVEGMRRL